MVVFDNFVPLMEGGAFSKVLMLPLPKSCPSSLVLYLQYSLED